MCHCSNMEVKWTSNKSQHTKLTRRRKFFLCSHQDSNSLSNMSAALYQQTISAPKICSTLSITFIILSKTLITAWNLMPLQPHMVTRHKTTKATTHYGQIYRPQCVVLCLKCKRHESHHKLQHRFKEISL